MRSSTILAAVTMVFLSVVSAQLQPSPEMQACETCLNNAAIAAVPACKDLVNNKGSAGTAPSVDKQKACICGLKSNNAWAESCVGPDKCSAGMKELLVMSLTAAVAQQPGICDNVSVTSAAAAAGTRFCGSSTTKVAAVGVAAVAIAGALL